MAVPLETVGTASATLALSKSAWKVGIAISKLHQDSGLSHPSPIGILVDKVKSLGNQCDLIFARLEDLPLANKEIESPPPYHMVNANVWKCLASQISDTTSVIQRVEAMVKVLTDGQSGSSELESKLNHSESQITNLGNSVSGSTENLRTVLLMVNTALDLAKPGKIDETMSIHIETLQNAANKLQDATRGGADELTLSELTLISCIRQVVNDGLAKYEASRISNPISKVPGSQNSASRVAEWITTLNSIRSDQSAATDSNGQLGSDGLEDDLNSDLAQAALEAGATAFEAQEWEEAECLLQEALSLLKQIHSSQQPSGFWDLFALQHKLAVCAFQTRHSSEAKEALLGLLQQEPASDDHKKCILEAKYLLACLYFRSGDLEKAQNECEQALNGQRRLPTLGKYHKDALHSTALMAHISMLSNNPSRAKAYQVMIPPGERNTIMKSVENILGLSTAQYNSSPATTSPKSTVSELAMRPVQGRLSATSLTESRFERQISSIGTITSPDVRERMKRISSPQPDASHSLSSIPPSNLPIAQISVPPALPTHIEESFPPPVASIEPSEDPDIFMDHPLSRKQILDNICCQPQERIEKAVCRGDQPAVDEMLKGKKGFWRVKFRSSGAPERITALHFAALFGEINIAQSLIKAGYNINEVPFGYSSRHSPLKFACGARQVDMVRFLVANGARPTRPDTWSYMASQLMNRAWLKMTMSEPEQEFLPSRIISVLTILLEHGWNINEPYEVSGETVLHQAVRFWTGNLRLDLELRMVVAGFLCNHGADPFRANADGKTPYDIAATSDERLLQVLRPRQNTQLSGNTRRSGNAVELPGHPIMKA